MTQRVTWSPSALVASQKTGRLDPESYMDNARYTVTNECGHSWGFGDEVLLLRGTCRECLLPLKEDALTAADATALKAASASSFNQDTKPEIMLEADLASWATSPLFVPQASPGERGRNKPVAILDAIQHRQNEPVREVKQPTQGLEVASAPEAVQDANPSSSRKVHVLKSSGTRNRKSRKKRNMRTADVEKPAVGHRTYSTKTSRPTELVHIAHSTRRPVSGHAAAARSAAVELEPESAYQPAPRSLRFADSRPKQPPSLADTPTAAGSIALGRLRNIRHRQSKRKPLRAVDSKSSEDKEVDEAWRVMERALKGGRRR